MTWTISAVAHNDCYPLRDIPEVVSEAMDVKVPVHDMEDDTPGEENVQEGRKMV